MEIITARMGSVRAGARAGEEGTIKRRGMGEGGRKGDIQTHYDITATII